MKGMPAVVRVSRWPWEGAPEGMCITFEVERAISRVEVTTAGLGHTFLAATVGDDRICDEHRNAFVEKPGLQRSGLAKVTATHWEEKITLVSSVASTAMSPSVTPGAATIASWIIALKLDPGALFADGTSIDGRVIVIAPDHGVTSLPLKLEDACPRMRLGLG